MSTKLEVWQRSSGQRNLLKTEDAGMDFHHCIPFNPLPRPGSATGHHCRCIPVPFQSPFSPGAQSSPGGCSQTQWPGWDPWLMKHGAAWPRFSLQNFLLSGIPYCRLSRSWSVSLQPNPGTLLSATLWRDLRLLLLLLPQQWAQQELLLRALTSTMDCRCQNLLGCAQRKTQYRWIESLSQWSSFRGCFVSPSSFSLIGSQWSLSPFSLTLPFLPSFFSKTVFKFRRATTCISTLWAKCSGGVKHRAPLYTSWISSLSF